MKTTEGHNMPIRLLEFTPGSKQLVSTGDDKQLNLWDIQEDKLKLKDTMWVETD